MEFRAKEPIRTKIIINYQIVEQASHYNSLGNDISYDRNRDIDVKLGKL